MERARCCPAVMKELDIMLEYVLRDIHNNYAALSKERKTQKIPKHLLPEKVVEDLGWTEGVIFAANECNCIEPEQYNIFVDELKAIEEEGLNPKTLDAFAKAINIIKKSV